MLIKGSIYGENNQPIKAVIWLGQPDEGINSEIILPGSQYTINYDYDPDYPNSLNELIIVVTAEGYQSLKTNVAELAKSGGDIYLKKNTASVWLLLIALGLLYTFSTKKKAVGKLQTSDVIPILIIAGAVIGFSFIRKLLETLGIWKTVDEKQLDATAASGDNWWNPNFYKTKPSHINYTNPITKSRADQLAKYLYDQFNFLNDDEDAAIAVFKSLPSQAAGSFLSESFRDITGQDMLTFLRGGVWPQDRLSPTDVNTINKYMLSLPKY